MTASSKQVFTYNTFVLEMGETFFTAVTAEKKASVELWSLLCVVLHQHYNGVCVCAGVWRLARNRPQRVCACYAAPQHMSCLVYDMNVEMCVFPAP